MKEPKSNPKILQWHSIAKFADNELTRVVGFIPLLGYLILFNDNLVNSISFSTIAGVENKLHNPFFIIAETKLRLAFFGCLFLFLSNVTFRFFAPSILEYSQNDMAFSDKVIESYSVSEIHSLTEAICSKKWRQRTPFYETFFRTESIELIRKNPVIGFRDKKYILSKFEANVRAAAREWWFGKMHEFPCARIATFSFTIIGYSFLLLPSLDVTQAVLFHILAS